MRCFQSPLTGTILILPCARRAASAAGESPPPITMTVGVVAAASFVTVMATKVTAASIPGMTSVGITIIEISVRRSRSMSRSSFR